MSPYDMYSTSMVWLNTADRPNPRVAITAPLTDVALSPILSERMPAKNERKNVDPIAREPTNAMDEIDARFEPFPAVFGP